MYRILIWGLGYKYSLYINAIKYCEMKGEIEVIGVTDRNMLYTCLDSYPFIPLDRIESCNVDYIVVTSDDNYREISSQAKEMGFPEKRIIMAKVFCIPGFCFRKYLEVFSSDISIIANNCWGGYAYHALGMKFYSPFINMFVHDRDYIKLLGNLRHYLAGGGIKLKCERWEYQAGLERYYPVCKIDDIELHFNHYANMEEVEAKWYDRVGRINWDNLFIMMFTNKWESIEAFDTLDYNKKICFVPFENVNLPRSAFSLQIANHNEMRNVPLYKMVNGIPKGEYHDYDLAELLLAGRVNHDRYCIK